MKEPSNSKFYIGTGIFVLGFLSPLLIPLVAKSDLSITWKASLSGLLALGIPEIFMIIAIAVMGRSGYETLMSKFRMFFKPPNQVSRARHRIGLIMFCFPLLFGWLQPYLGHFTQELQQLPMRYYLIGDGIFLASFFVLGGEFWGKFSGLFKRGS